MKTLTTIPVELGERSYPIQIGRGWIDDLGSALSERLPGRRFAIVTNSDIEPLWAGRIVEALGRKDLEAEVFTIPEGEAAKTLQTVSLIYDFLIERKYERGAALLALGGGVVGDIVGFAAATFLRGVDLVQLPTSLLAMVDSSVGGKTGVNHRLGKNLIGAFQQPSLVAIDLDFLQTLPTEEFRSGMAEAVKHGMILDADYFGFIETNAAALLSHREEPLTRLIARSCEIKASVVARDERENDLRAILNFGHTFAHAAETLSDYEGIRHGEAVAMGMMAACRLGVAVAGFPPSSGERLGSLLDSLGLPLQLPSFAPEDYLEAMKSDKKLRLGKIRLVVPTQIGSVELRDDIEESAIIEALEASF